MEGGGGEIGRSCFGCDGGHHENILKGRQCLKSYFQFLFPTCLGHTVIQHFCGAL